MLMMMKLKLMCICGRRTCRLTCMALLIAPSSAIVKLSTTEEEEEEEEEEDARQGNTKTNQSKRTSMITIFRQTNHCSHATITRPTGVITNA